MKPSGKVPIEIILKECDELLSDDDRMRFKKLIKDRKKSALGSERLKKQGSIKRAI
jgi:hypothetical protein